MNVLVAGKRSGSRSPGRRNRRMSARKCLRFPIKRALTLIWAAAAAVSLQLCSVRFRPLDDWAGRGGPLTVANVQLNISSRRSASLNGESKKTKVFIINLPSN
uniref:Uncharacterized protein n=1 Tax=Echeneis naucrates TaxID=173247 RepID=A0A665VR70_ECHNA